MPFIDDGFEALLEPFYNGKKLTDPVSTKEDKFQLLPAFLKVKGKPRPRLWPLYLAILTEVSCRSCQAVSLHSTVIHFFPRVATRVTDNLSDISTHTTSS
jgi:hypothetical protein